MNGRRVLDHLAEHAVDVAPLPLVLVVRARGEVDLADQLELPALARHPHRAALGVERA